MSATSEIGWRRIPRGLRDEQNEFDLSANQQGSIQRQVQPLGYELLLYTENKTPYTAHPKIMMLFFSLNDSYKCRSESPFGFSFCVCVCVCSRMSHLSISQPSRPFGPSLISQSVKSPEGKQLPRSPFPPLFPSPISNRQPLLKDSCVWTLGH